MEINEKFKNKKQAAFIPFVVVGDPDLETTEKAVQILIEEGADLIELGVPFSDALADGPVIQAASERASQHTTLSQVLAFSTRIRKQHAGFPFVLFTYYNPIFKMGVEAFAKQAKAAGIYAVLVVDLPPEEADAYVKVLKNEGVGTVFLASPTTSRERFLKVSELSSAFIYYVSRAGVTGVQSKVSETLDDEIKSVRKLTEKPIAIGFGISNGEQARQVSQLADAVVVGSVFVKLIAENDPIQKLDSVRKLAREIKAGIKRES